MRSRENGHSTDLLFVLLIFASFVLSAVMLISLGSGEFERIIGRMQDNDLSRITSAYLTQKIRQGKAEDAITTEDFHGIPSLCIRAEIAGQDCETFLYVYEGELMELLTPVKYEDDVIPAGGNAIVPMERLDFQEIRPGTVLIDGVTGDGSPLRTLITIAPQ